jgi:peptidyl-prolyl cis-trans isomerase D
MALINKIRERSGIVIGIIAVSLILFIVGGDIFGSGGFFSGNPNKVGEIAGKDISQEEFGQQTERLKANYESQTGRPAGEDEMPGIREQVWNQFIVKYAYQKEFEKLGITVPDEEVFDMVQGNNISPIIKQAPAFANPQTGQFDKSLVQQYMSNLKKAPLQNQLVWKEFEDGIRAERLRSKYENLMALSNYVTTQEAKREYEAQTEKASVKYLYVPFYSIIDSTIKVTDSQLEEYMNKHKNRYKGSDTRSLQYVTFSILPSAKDSADFLQEIKDLAKGLATAENDSAYARANTDEETDPGYIGIGQMSEPLRATLGTFFKGGVYGPYQEGDTYAIYKLLDSKQDTVYSIRASHILITPTNQTDSAKTAARKKAEGLLAQIKAGASFEDLARTNGSDGTASRGGDLGWYTQGGGFVKPFEDALFRAPGKGLVPNLVETQFGYHLVKITEPKTNQRYKFATIKKTIAPSDETNDEAYNRAELFAAQSPTLEAFRENLKKDPSLVPFTAERVRKDARNLNSLQNAREVILWAFNDETELNKVNSKPFQVDNQYVVAVVTNKTSADKATINDFRDEITMKVRNELKAEQILKKLGAANGKLEDLAKAYGPQAVVETASDVTLSSASLKNVGFDPAAVGRIFGLKKGQRSKPFAGESGVMVLELENLTPAPEIADYSQYKNQLQQTYSGRTTYYLTEAIKDNSKIEDNRSKFY